MKLCQLIAIVAGRKTNATKEITALHHLAQKGDLMTGISRNYTPKDEEGDMLPPESKKVQNIANNIFQNASKIWTKLFDTVAMQDIANCTAKADVVVGEQVIFTQAPVTFLLFLEKQLTAVRTFITNLPVLEPHHDWIYDGTKGFYKTPPTQQNRTKKIQTPLVAYEATKEHPAQIQLISEDVNVGTWETVHFSGKIPADTKKCYLAKVQLLIEAVKIAREEANSLEISTVAHTSELFDFIFTE